MSGDRGRKGGEADDVGLGLTDWVIRHASRSLASVAILSMTSVICEPIRLICRNSYEVIKSRQTFLSDVVWSAQVSIEPEIEVAKSSI
jgi:protein subunit release factor B